MNVLGSPMDACPSSSSGLSSPFALENKKAGVQNTNIPDICSIILSSTMSKIHSQGWGDQNRIDAVPVKCLFSTCLALSSKVMRKLDQPIQESRGILKIVISPNSVKCMFVSFRVRVARLRDYAHQHLALL